MADTTTLSALSGSALWAALDAVYAEHRDAATRPYPSDCRTLTQWCEYWATKTTTDLGRHCARHLAYRGLSHCPPAWTRRLLQAG